MNPEVEFYKEENFKVVEADGFKLEVPEDWEVVRLGVRNVATIRKNKLVNNVEEVAFIPMELIPNSNIYVTYQIRNLSEVKSSIYCEAGDLLLAKITPCLENGKQGIVPENIPNGFALTTTEVFPIVCIGIDRFFLFYILKYPKFRKMLEYSMRGTTGRQRVPKEAVVNLLIPYPPLPEQQKIAHVLTSIDKAIEAVDEAIKQAERIKKGLMQELLSGRVRIRAENGKFSFYREERFKDTEIGKVPQDWEVVRLGDVVEVWDKYRVPVKEEMRKHGSSPYCGANGIIDYVDGYTHEGEFVLLAEDGGYFGKFENSAYIMRGKFWANNHVHVLKAINNFLINEYLVFYLNFANLVPYLTGSTRPKLTQEDMKKILVVLPPLPEQKAIAEILSKWDEVIELKRAKKERLERMKKKVMELLLTGKVRIKGESE